jgi:hypothetical protein
MKNSLERLAKAGLVKPFEGSESQLKARLELAKRDIQVAKATMAHDRDTTTPPGSYRRGNHQSGF